MNILIKVIAGVAVFISSIFSQVEQVDNTARIKGKKIELEEAKEYRDKVITKRWDDKRKYNESREKFNEDYDEAKEKLETLSHEQERLKEEIETALRDVEQLKGKKDAERIRFLGLSSLQHNALREASEVLDKRFPREVAKRLELFNSAKKSAGTKKDSPTEILNEVLQVYQSEIALTRNISIEKGGFNLSDNTPGMGYLLKVGTIASAYYDEKSKRTGIQLRTANATGQLFAWREDLTPNAKNSLNEQLTGLTSGKSTAGFVVLPMDVLRTRLAGRGYTQGEQKGVLAQIKNYMADGGFWMWPLGAIALVAFILLAERFVFWGLKSKSSKVLNHVMTLVEKGNIDQAQKIAGASKSSPVLKAIAKVLSSQEKNRDIAEKELQEVLMSEGPRLERRLTTISVLGAAAPLLGLLGTVAGMIGMFNTITIYGTSDPKLMAGDISVALITTQTGLAISVPVMIAHNFLANRVDGLTNKMETYALKTLNLLWPNG